MNPSPPQVPLFRIMLGNASLLSVVYLLVGVAVEIIRRFRPQAGWVTRAVLVLDSLPARTLEVLGLMEPIRHAYVYGRLNEAMLRVIFSGTTIAVIFLMALVVGGGMWLVRRLIYRRYSEL